MEIQLMRWKNLIIAGAIVSLAGFRIAAIAQEAATEPSEEKATRGVVAPFNLLTDLTDDQKSQIEAIHKDELAAEKKLREKEQDDCMAVLTDPQKTELTDLVAKEGIERRAGSAEKRAQEEEAKAKALEDKANDAGATTQP
jgi:Spy/CpxP family protein refolding chaperone